MRVRWTTPALQQFAEIIRYIRRDNKSAAQRVKARISSEVASLSAMEHRGRTGEVKGTEELVFVPWPYIVVYEVSANQVHILAVRHAAQEWPPQ